MLVSLHDLHPMIQAIDILVFLHWPIRRHVSHANFLSLVDKRRAGLESQENSDELGAIRAVLGVVVDKSANRPRLVVVLDVEGVPAVVVVHETLPFVDFGLEL